jgi:hypothetical protein
MPKSGKSIEGAVGRIHGLQLGFYLLFPLISEFLHGFARVPFPEIAGIFSLAQVGVELRDDV